VDWKDLPATNTLAYYEHFQIQGVTSFITFGTGVNIIKLFYLLINTDIK